MSETRPKSKRIRWILAGVGLALAGMVVGFFALKAAGEREGSPNFLATLYFQFASDTRFGPGYSGSAFESIRIGDNEAKVVTALGAPLNSGVVSPWSGWVYGTGPIAEFERNGQIPSDQDYTFFRFDPAGRVESVSGIKVGSTSSPSGSVGPVAALMSGSLSTFTIGDGQNILGLTDLEIRELTGKPMAEIEARFGVPPSEYQSDAVKVLIYSDSPTSGNYLIRRFSIDAKGLVSEIRRGYWFD